MKSVVYNRQNSNLSRDVKMLSVTPVSVTVLHKFTFKLCFFGVGDAVACLNKVLAKKI